MRTLLTALACALLLLFPAAAQSTAAEDEEPAFRLEHRDVALAVRADGFRFQSERASELADDTITADFDLQTAALTYTYRAESPRQDTLAHRVTFTAVTEYRDADGDGRYSLPDTAVQRFDIASVGGGTVERPLLGDADQAVVTYPLPASSGDGGGTVPVGEQEQLPADGRLELRVLMVERPTQTSGRSVSPTEADIQIRITDFPYRQEDTRLALEVRVMSAPHGIDLQEDPARYASIAPPFQTYTTWDPEATADGQATPAAATHLAHGEDEALMVFDYGRGDDTTHHMQTGTLATQGAAEEVARLLAKGDWRIYLAGLLGTLLVAGVPAAYRLRQGA